MFSSRPSVPPRPRYLHGRKRKDAMDVKTVAQNNRKDDKNVKNATNNTSSTLNRITRVPAASVRPRIGEFGRSTMGQTKAGLGKKNTIPTTSKFKPKTVHLVPEPSSDLDPNCNEPSLPCLCCDGHTPQDNRCVYNHNYNNNNTIAARTNIQLQPEQKHIQDEDPKIQQDPALGTHEITQNEPTPTESQPLAEKIEKPEMNSNEAEESDVHDEEDDDDDEDEDEDTLVPSCYDCPPSLLEFSLSSSTSSSSTSISSCSDFESDCPDTVSLSSQEAFSEPSLTSRSPSTEIQIIKVQSQHVDALSLTPCSPDEGYPSARSSPLSEFLEKKGSLEQEGTKVDLLGLIDSMEELDKVGHINMIVQVARWDLEGDLGLKDRLSHLDRLELVNRQVKMIHLERIREAGLDLLEEDFSDALDGMGFDVSWKLYKGSNRCDSQEFSDAGVDLTAPSDIDETLAPDSLAPSPLQPPPRPPKPPKRQIETHTYMNVEDVKIATSEKPTPSFASSATKSEQPVPQSPSQSIPYFTFFSPTPTLVSPSPPPPIPPPRRRHKARLEAQKFAELHDEPTPVSLPAPTTRPPPLPPPPAFPSPPAIPPPPSLPPPPSFHALDAEIRKLLVLAGLTQAELLKLSPELGVCVTGVLEEGEAELLETVATEVRKDESEEKKETHCESKKSNEWKQCAKEEMTELAFKDARGQSAHDGVTEARGDNRESFRTTSFTEMARRRKRNSGNFSSSCNCGYGLNPIPNHDPYFSSMDGNTDDLNSSRNNNDYAEIPCSTPPPPPPPRPLPPCPPCLSHPILAPALQPLDLCTIPANASRPDRFDWLMAFSPDTETPLSAIGKSTERSPLKKKEGTKTTTFKELRFRSRQNPPAAPSAPPEPDPTVVTPDPDVLYNLKWRKGKPDGDGSQWEYVPQLQSFLLQPPTTLTSLKEALHMRNTEREAEGHASKFIGFSISDSNLWTSGSGEEVKPQRKTLEKEKEKEEDGEVRGSADGGRKWESRTTAVRSLSFAGSAQRDETWMEDPDIGSKQSSVCLREKKALLSTVSVAVEAVLGHFSSSRTQVQKAPPQSLTDVKAQLGDSSINPSLGWLVLQCLCPALRDLLADGLKPHQSDVIAGRRPNTPWSLVQASTKPGPSTQALYSLQCRVADLPQLRQSRHRFNAFLFGLLNVKLLDYWLSHLHSCDDVLQAYYLPTSFMRFSHSLGRSLFEELLLVLQPLSLLSFSLDLLFQHHHVDPASPGPSPLSPPSLTSEGGSPEACELQDRDSSSLSQQASQALQHGWGAVVRWGERLGQAWTNSSSPAQPDVVLHPSEGGPVMPWALGRLFGVTKGDSSTVTRTSPTRRPSHWLAPGVSALSRMVRPTAQSPVDEERPSMATHPALTETGDALTPYRSVRTLCEHTGTGAELSFQKGEELVVLGSVDHDWIRCRRGDREGLVSIGYTSLIM